MLPPGRPLQNAVAGLNRGRAVGGTWFRAIQPQHHATALATQHTRTTRSRFNAGPLLQPADQFDILYLAETPLVALFEVGAMLGTPFRPGGSAAAPWAGHLILNVSVKLSDTIDLSDTSEQGVVETTAQELTGDWDAYHIRSLAPPPPVRVPAGSAPTQDLGLELSRLGIEGFVSLSARVPTQRILAILPSAIRPGSDVSWFDPITGEHRRLGPPVR